MQNQSLFKSRFGMIAAVGGSVVGLGNIWRFPYLAGENGGAAFIIVYIAVSFLIAVPIMISELSVGRYARSNVKHAYDKVRPGGKWGLIGMVGIITSFAFISFYSVISGWALEFIKESIMGGFINKDSDEISSYLSTFINSGWRPVIWTFIFIFMTGLIVIRGVEKGIEKFAKIILPLVIIILIGLIANSFTLSGFSEGVTFLLKPDFSKVDGSMILSALGQAFFSLSLGMGCMVTYGAYIKSKENIVKTASFISIADLAVAVLSGFAIFPAVFTYGISPTSGPELVFATMPNVFAKMSGGYFISIIFFILLFFAAITSSISMLETLSAYVKDEFKFSRKKAVIVVMCIVLVTSTLCALSQMDNSPFTVLGIAYFDLFDTFTSNYLLPIGGLLSVLFVGWFARKQIFRDELTNQGTANIYIFPVIKFLIRFVVPVFIVVLFLSQLGLLKL